MILLLGIYLTKMKTYIHTKTCTQMLRESVTHNSQKVETTQMTINWEIDKQNEVYPFRQKKEQSTDLLSWVLKTC